MTSRIEMLACKAPRKDSRRPFDIFQRGSAEPREEVGDAPCRSRIQDEAACWSDAGQYMRVLQPRTSDGLRQMESWVGVEMPTDRASAG